MGVTEDEVRRMAELARLKLNDAEAGTLMEDLRGILEHMEELAEVPALPGDPAGNPPPEDRAEREPGEAHRSGPAPLRDGESERPDSLDRPPASFAPSWQDGFFVVPRLPALEDEDEESGGRTP